MSDRVKGKVALVTGGASGMGRAHSILLAEEGAKVIVTDVNEEMGKKTVQKIKDDGGEAIFLKLDVSKSQEWQDVIQKSLDAFGKIDILVNNAGILLMKTVDETTEEEWDRIFSINAKGVFLGCKYVLPAMKKAGQGSIINISSIYGLVGAPSAAAYEATKGAVRLLTKATAVDYVKYNIRVNSIHPGVIVTEMTKDILADENLKKSLLGPTLLPRPADPKEVSYAVLFLASDESSYMTGSEVVVDGGYTAN